MTSFRLRWAASSAGAIAAFLGIAEVHPAQVEDARLRGKVVSLNGSTLWVNTREGTDAAVALKPGWKVTGVTSASLANSSRGILSAFASLPCPSRPEETTAGWVAQTLPAAIVEALAAGGRSGTGVSLRINYVILGPNRAASVALLRTRWSAL